MSDDVPVADMAKKTEIKWSSKYNDEDADVELVSSDGWHFKVHSYRLQTFSTVFRNMISMATSSTQRNPIIFTDEIFEVGRVIRLFLDAIYDGSIEGINDDAQIIIILGLIKFAEKWECQTIFDMFDQRIRLSLLGSEDVLDSLDQFLIAVEMKRFELAGRMLRIRPSQQWDVPKAQSSTGFKRGNVIGDHSVFDLSATSFPFYVSVEPEIAWALLRSSLVAKEDTTSGHYEDKLGDEFVRLMRTKYPLKPQTTVTKKRPRDEL